MTLDGGKYPSNKTCDIMDLGTYSGWNNNILSSIKNSNARGYCREHSINKPTLEELDEDEAKVFYCMC